MGALFLEQGDINQADSFFKQARETAEQVNSKEQLKETYLSLSKSAEKKGRQDEALQYFQQYQMLKDSLSEVEKQRQLTLMESTYLAQKRELEIQRMEKEQAQQKNVQNITLGGMGILILLSFGFWQRMGYQRKKKEAEMEQQRATQLEKLDQLKDQFLANTSHELRTPLNGIIGLAESLSEGGAGKLPDEAIENLHIIALSGRLFLQKAQYYRDHGVPDDWTGVEEMRWK